MLSSEARARINLRIAILEKQGYPLPWEACDEVIQLQEILAGQREWVEHRFDHEFPTTIIQPDRNPYPLRKLANNNQSRRLAKLRGEKDLHQKGPRKFRN